jgi:hypothetical protein
VPPAIYFQGEMTLLFFTQTTENREKGRRGEIKYHEVDFTLPSEILRPFLRKVTPPRPNNINRY